MKLLSSILILATVLAASTFAWSDTTESDNIDNFVDSVKVNRDKYKDEHKKQVLSDEPTVQNEPVKPVAPFTATPEVTESAYIVVPFEFSIIPPISTSGLTGHKVINNFVINIIASYSAQLNGVEVGMINLKSEKVSGVQVASALNYSGGSMSGVQISGGLNFVQDNVNGVQITGGLNYAGKVNGLQIAPVNFALDNVSAQTGVINYSGEFNGLQIGIINFTGSFKGIQTGVVNISGGKSSGIQIGVVNISDEFDGAPIGLISIVRKGETHPFVWYDDQNFITAGLKHGTKNWYNIYAVGMDKEKTLYKETLGMGLHLPISFLSINIDGTTSLLHSFNKPYYQFEGLLSNIRLSAQISLFEHLSIIGGVSYNYLATYSGMEMMADHIHYKTFINNTKHQFWPGFFAGIEF